MKYTTVIFDLDGTLINSIEDLYISTNYALQQCSYPTRTLEEVTSFVGNGVKLLMDRSVPIGTNKEDTARCLSIFKEHYQTHMKDHTKPYPGIMDLLVKLNRFDIKTAIVSNKFDPAVKQLNQDYFKDIIPIAIGESPTVRKKPAPDSVFEAMKQLEAIPSETLYVGDSDVDMDTAHHAGIDCAGVTWGFRSEAVLKEHNATYIVSQPSELFDLCNAKE